MKTAMKYAAYDDMSIYALGDTPEQAIDNARSEAKDPYARFSTAPISDTFAAWIEVNGWDGKNRSFAIDKYGYLIDTTYTPTAKRHKWPCPHDWLSDYAHSIAGHDDYGKLLVEIINDLAGRLDSNSIQDLFRPEMDADGYFNETAE